MATVKLRYAMPKPCKFCMVPYCTNTSTTEIFPTKVFFYVPNEPEIRNLWLTAAGLNPKNILPTSMLYCCADHFDLPNAIENWKDYEMSPINTVMIMKKGIVPHKFQCQKVYGKAYGKKRKRSVNDDNTNVNKTEIIENKKKIKQDNMEHEIKIYKLDKSIISIEDVEQTIDKPKRNIFLNKKFVAFPTTSNSVITTTTSKENNINSLINFNLHFPNNGLHDPLAANEDSKTTYFNYNFNPSNKKDLHDFSVKSSKIGRIDLHSKQMKENSSVHMGIPKNFIFIVDLLSEKLKIKEQDIILCLKKIRRDINYSTLANDFGITVPSTTRCLNKLLPGLSRYFKQYIFWPSSEKIFENLPRAFRKNFFNINSIIDCLEITIPTPENSLQRALSWSAVQRNYTIKYLISYTPDGFINFVSDGFEGSRSDSFILEISGYLDVVPFGINIMIISGFLDVEHLFSRKGCKLFRPPNFKTSLHGMYLKETRETISIGMHTEQMIRRFRNFFITKRFTAIDSRMLSVIDDAVLIAAGLMNLQNSLWDMRKK